MRYEGLRIPVIRAGSIGRLNKFSDNDAQPPSTEFDPSINQPPSLPFFKYNPHNKHQLQFHTTRGFITARPVGGEHTSYPTKS